MKNKLKVIPPKMTGIEKTKAAEIQALFTPMLETMKNYETEFNQVVAMKPSQVKVQEARKLRLKYVKVRTGTAKIHKEAKAYHLAAGKAIDGFKNAQIFAGQEIEEELTAIEKHDEIQKAKEVGEIGRKRGFELAEFGVPVIAHPPMLGEWTEEVWIPYLEGIKVRYKQMKEDKLQAEKKAAEEIATKAAEQAIKDREISNLRAELSAKKSVAAIELQESNGATISVDTETGEIIEKDDKRLALELILDLNNLSNKYTFKGDQYKFAYGKMGERFAKMEQYLRRLNKSAL